MQKFFYLTTALVLSTVLTSVAQSANTDHAFSKYRRNTLGINPAFAHNGAYAFGVFAERRMDALHGRMSLTLPVHVVVGRDIGTPNAISLNYEGARLIEIDSVRSPRFVLMPGIRINVGSPRRALQYALGVSALLEGGRYGVVRDSVFSTRPAIHEEAYGTRYRAGAMFTQAWTYAIQRRVQVGFETSFGSAFFTSQPPYGLHRNFFVLAGFHVGYMLD